MSPKLLIRKTSANLTAEINTKVANELSSRVSEISDKSTAEISKIKNDIYSNFTTEIQKINSHDAGYASEVQKIFNMTTRINNIEEVCCNEFGKISFEFNASIEALQNK